MLAVLLAQQQAQFAQLQQQFTTNKSRTALILAASDDQKLITPILLDHGAIVNATDELGLTALHVACMQGFHAMSTILIKGGADMESKSLEGGNNKLVHVTSVRAKAIQIPHCELQ